MIHLPLPPEPNLALCSSAEVFLQRTGNTGKLAASHQELTAGVVTVETGVVVSPLFADTSSCWMTIVLSSPPDPSVAIYLEKWIKFLLVT